MSVLSFRRNARFVDAQPVGDWQEDELAQIFGAYRMLAQNGVPIGLDRGRTDAGEPWVVFFDLNTQDVFLHVARIGGEYLLACEALGVTLSGARLTGLLQAFEAEMRRYLAVEMSKNDNVITHPAARLMITMTAVFLLSRMDNGDVAFARAQGDDQEEAADRKAAEASIVGRAQKIVTKLYEAGDTPTMIAAIAGILVSLELFGDKPQYGSADLSDQINAWMAQWSERDKTLALEADAHISQDHLAHVVIQSEIEAGTVEAAELAIEAPSSLVMPASVDLSVGLTGKLLVEGTAKQSQDVVVQRDDDSEQAPVVLEADKRPAEVAAEEEVLETSPSETVSRTTETKVESGPIVVVMREEEPETSVAIDLVESVLVDLSVSLVFFEAIEQDEPDGALVDAGDSGLVASQEMPTAEYVETAFGIDDLAEITSVAGFVHNTSFARALSVEALRYFIDTFDAYEVEVADTVVLIEQRLEPDIDAESIGIWTNRMSDGSEVTVLGQAELVSGIATLFEVA